ncbi:ABC transporter ATP-binding protein/permease [Corynebacterium sp. CCM 9185]|uniref:ABC transporter ATP-binding protein n=1 Tax=Corynebacterium marambiense TaxID=2765364 RepID=A0ABS0VT92_9CORY|nr:ABC transporter ATP-binding protein [Corynebacterium marambiense]MBI8999996.1 ABC transporter ATP-binding protein [Corynebacterium marambiense]MCK7663348.1 ABC transporter ATP-binding protein/permease [Corynebacterium marambiense]MCX7542218.1 ABC transporter ATP-binding protein [Corynebacterium marambiense]
MAATRFDPLQLAVLRRQMSPEGNREFTVHLTVSVASGIFEGLALLSLLPAAAALATGETAAGLPFGAWLGILAILAVVTFYSRYRQAVTGYGAVTDYMRCTHHALGDHLATLPLGWFSSASTGGLSRLVSSGFMLVSQILAHMLHAVVTQVSSLVVVTIGVWIWDWRIGLTLTLTTPLIFASLALLRRYKNLSDQKVARTDRELSDRLVEFAICQPELRAAGHTDDFGPLVLAGEHNDSERMRDLKLSVVLLGINGLVLQMAVVALITAATLVATAGSMNPVETVAFIGLILRYSQNLQILSDSFTAVTVAQAPIARMGAILDTPVFEEPTQPAVLDAPGRVELRDVSFGYSDGTPVLRSISFTAESGTLTALVGPSGSGKTTIARLICRFYDTDEGSVCVGGADVRDQSTEQLMKQVSMVFQDVYLFDDTLEANIRIGRPDATDKEVHEAARMAGVDAIADRLGWDAKVGEGGRSLSGGERQRVSVARALLKKAPIVLLDEATAALDAENEANIVASVAELARHSTVIAIAHKLDTVRAADQIIVLDEDGHVTQKGTHDELITRRGPYRQFCERREAAAGWRLTHS